MLILMPHGGCFHLEIPATDTPSYDIFISYRTTRRPWVGVLADNLAAQGYKVFLDHRELVPGANFTCSIFDALQHSRLALLIATPEAAESGTLLMVLAQADTNTQHYAHALKTSLQFDYALRWVVYSAGGAGVIGVLRFGV